jgi:hypothetical protein
MIALDSVTYAAWVASGTSITFAHTCTGSDLLLLVDAYVDTTGDKVTGITYNGDAMTRHVRQRSYHSDVGHYLYYLLNPDTGGSYNVVISLNASCNTEDTAVSYTGCLQSSFPHASNNGQGANPAGDPFNMTVTTTVEDCWLYGNIGNYGTFTITNGTRRYSGGVLYTDDSNGARSSGSNSLNYTPTAGGATGWLVVAIAPAVSAGPAKLKTANTLAVAKIKTIDSLAIAKVKTIDSLA